MESPGLTSYSKQKFEEYDGGLDEYVECRRTALLAKPISGALIVAEASLNAAPHGNGIVWRIVDKSKSAMS